MIQTVLPYAIKNNRKLIIDGHLHEWSSTYHPSINANKRYSEYICMYVDYPRKRGVLETPEEVLTRVMDFVVRERERLNASLVCSHQGILSAFIALSKEDYYDERMRMGEVRTIVIDIDDLNLAEAMSIFRHIEGLSYF